MINLGIGQTRIIFSTRARWERRVPDPKRFGDEKVLWSRRGIALALTVPGYWGPAVVWLFRIPLTRKVVTA